jgi:hypothetical protein
MRGSAQLLVAQKMKEKSRKAEQKSRNISKEEEHISRCRLVRSDATLKAKVTWNPERFQQTQKHIIKRAAFPKSLSRMGVRLFPSQSHLQKISLKKIEITI